MAQTHAHMMEWLHKLQFHAGRGPNVSVSASDDYGILTLTRALTRLCLTVIKCYI